VTVWDDRIARARSLAATHPAAAAMLTFYADLAAYQRALQPVRPSVPSTRVEFASVVDIETASQAVLPFLSWLGRHAPAPLAEAASRVAAMEPRAWREPMARRLALVDLEEPIGFIVDAVLQPFAEVAARAWSVPSDGTGLGARDAAATTKSPGLACCPVCGSPPVVAALREEGQGAKRVLLCSLCSSEWDYLRVLCPACDEQRFDALPVYTTESIPHVRVDACDSCRVYLKTVDLTKDGHAVPLVDDIATVSLDLWAREAGYTRLHHNLLRL
jgi:FdhE protein